MDNSSEDEGNLLGSTEVGDPVPGEEALDADGDIGSEGGEGVEEELLVGGDLLLADDVAGLIEDADGEEPGVQVDAAVESMLTCVESHHGLRVGGCSCRW